MADSTFLFRFKKWAVAGAPVTCAEHALQFGRVAEVLKRFISTTAREFVVSSAHRPLLYTYASDGTPVRCTTTFRTSMIQGSKVAPVARKGGEGTDMVIERGFLVTHGSRGALISKPLLRDAIPLSYGHGTWKMFTAAKSFLPHLRLLGHRNICITHVCFDRAQFSSLSRVMAQRQAAFYEVGEWAGTGRAHLAKQEDWFLATGCAAHDCQNALKWGQHSAVPDPGAAVSGLYIGIESCRNGYNLLWVTLTSFLRESLQFARHALPAEAELWTMWTDIGLAPGVADELATLGLICEHGHVWVRPELEGTPDLLGRVHGAIASVMKFHKFTESRWATVGECSRNFVAAHLLGLPLLIERIKESSLSDYYIHGYWDYCHSPSRKYGVVAAMSARVVDAALLMVLDDDRLAGRAQELEAAMQEEWQWLVRIPESTWQRLAGVVSDSEGGCQPGELREDCLIAAQTSYSFVHWRLMCVLLRYPWALCEGSIVGNLVELKNQAEAPGTDDTSDKIYDLMQHGKSPESLARPVELLQQCPFSTRGVEQAHASCAVISRLHPQAGPDHVTGRGLLHAAKPLVQNPETDRMQRKIASIEAKIRRLGKKSGTGRTGRQLFAGEMIPGVVEQRKDPASRKSGSQWCIANYHELWDELSPSEKAKYEERAKAKREAYFAEIEEQVLTLRQELCDKQAALAAMKRGEGLSPVTLSGSRFSDGDLQGMADMHDSEKFSRQAVLSLRQEAAEQKGIPDHEKDKLTKIPVDLGQDSPKMSDWLQQVARYRDHFRGKVIVTSIGTDRQMCLFFSFALQQPLVTAFQKLSKIQVVLPPPKFIKGKDISEMMNVLDAIWRWQFRVELKPPVYGWELNHVPRDEVWVLMNCEIAEGIIQSPSDPVPFADFVNGLPLPAPKPSTKKKNPAWDKYVKPGSAASGSGEPAAKRPRVDDDDGHGGSDGDDHPVEELGVDEKAKLREWLAAKKVELSAMREVNLGYFSASFRGSSWTAAKRGVGSDVAVGENQDDEAGGWAKKACGNRMSSFGIRAYDEDLAGALACLWADRMEFFYQCHREGRLVDGRLTPALREEAPKPTFVEELLAKKANEKHPGHARLKQVLQVEPR